MRLLKQLGAVGVVAFAGSLGVGAVHWNVPLTLLLGVATAVLAGVVLTIVFMWLARRRGHLVPVRRRTAPVDPAATLVP